jgi:anti-sigma-K factor RskA
MAPHEEYRKLCAAATAGELTADEQAKLHAHLASCPECRRAMDDYETASRHAVAALASELTPKDPESDGSWSIDEAEKELLRRLRTEEEPSAKPAKGPIDPVNGGQRFTYRPSQVEWRDVWISLAAVMFLALVLAITSYRTGVKRGTDIARTTTEVPGNSNSLEEQLSDTGHERAGLVAELAQENKLIVDLKPRLSEQQDVIKALKITNSGPSRSANSKQLAQASSDSDVTHEQGIVAAQAKLTELQKSMDILTRQRDEATSRAAMLEAKGDELTQLVRSRERELEQKQEEIARGQELLEHDRDIRELMGARDLYIAEIHDVSGTGETNKTYGRVFYTKGKRLIFYAYDLDAQPGIRNASTFQAWGRRGPDNQQARNLGVFYEDNLSKKRWVLKADDPKTLQDIDAVFVTVEPNGGSPHPSGKPLLFAYLRVNPNHP